MLLQPFNNAPGRYLPDRPLPAYRHIPGCTPHPVTSSGGHSVGLPPVTCAPLTDVNWPEHEAWLFGADLFNSAYWWEAHEQWEAPWRLAEPGGDTARLLQGLIQLAAALLKWNLRNERGRAGLWRRGSDHLRSVSRDPWLGVQVGPLVVAAAAFFERYPEPPGRRPEGPGGEPRTGSGPVRWPAGPVLHLVPDTEATR